MYLCKMSRSTSKRPPGAIKYRTNFFNPAGPGARHVEPANVPPRGVSRRGGIKPCRPSKRERAMLAKARALS